MFRMSASKNGSSRTSGISFLPSRGRYKVLLTGYELVIFRKHYTDYQFKRSNSIKNVLPVLVPNLSYEDLEVNEGSVAQVAWNELLETTHEKRENELESQMLEYCGQDTFGMVEIHKYIVGSTKL